MNFVLNRQPLGVEDLTLGIATVPQTRGGNPVVITQLNASNIPYDATDDIKTAIDSKVLDPMTTRGDVIVRNASNVTARLGVGTSGQVLGTDGLDIAWVTPAGTDHTLLSNIGTNTHAQIDTALTRLVNTSGTNTGDQDLSGYSLTSHNHSGVYEPADTTILKDADIGSTVQAYNTNTTIAGNTFNGISQLVQTDGTGKYPALDGSLITNLASGFADPMTTRGDMIVRDATNVTARLGVGTAGQVLGTDGTDIVWTTSPSGVTDHTLLSNIGINTHAQIDTDLVRLANTSGTNTGDQVLPVNSDFSLDGLSNVVITTNTDKELLAWDSTSSKWINQTPAEALLATSTHTHTGVYEPADATILKDSDIGSTVQGYDVDTAKLDVLQTFTAAQRSNITTDNDLSFNLAVTNKFKCTPTALGTLTFTNLASQSGMVILDNTGGFAISLAASIKAKSGVATTLSTAGVYLIGYDCDGTNVYITVSAAMV